jgi:hypothetical protein
MSVTAMDIIGDFQTAAQGKIDVAQKVLAGEDLEGAIRFYLQAAKAVVDGLRDAGVLLAAEAEYLPADQARTDELLRQINVYLKSRRLFPLLSQAAEGLNTCRDRWVIRVERDQRLGMPRAVAQPLVDEMPLLLQQLNALQESLCAEPGGVWMTGVGRETLRRVRDALESHKGPEEIRTIVRQWEVIDAGDFDRIDGLIRALSTMATKLAAATRMQQ